MNSPFDDFYGGLFGSRWHPLKAALLRPAVKVTFPLFNHFSQYVLDPASVSVARQLLESLPKIGAEEKVLDMCAAPGGKAMVILDALVNSGWKGEFIANELSYARRKRLEEVVRTHVPDASRSQIRVKGWDASQIGIRAKETYSRVILDAPCSSERHLLEQDPTMQEWKISRTKQLAQRQYALICSAVLALKPGGVLLYSTCSLSDFENDGVVERLLDRKGDQIQLDPTFQPGFEKTKFGFYILPDRVEGQGPLYFCRLLKSN